MQLAHSGHIGETSMKRIMREFFWWPGMASDVEKFMKNCETCAKLSRKNPPVPLSNRELPDGPWEIIQIDFLSLPSFGTGEFLIIVDTYSRYLSVVQMKHTDAESTNAALCEVFKTWGCPKIIQSDNGPPFQSSSFIEFWENKGVRVRKSIPLCPQTNGLVERQNQGIIKTVAASRIDGVNWRFALQHYVHNHNTLIPHSRLRVTPFELMVGWKFRGTFPSLWSNSDSALDRTDIRERDAEAKLTSKRHADTKRGAKESDIMVGDKVLLLQQKRSKIDPNFSTEQFTVVIRDGPKVVILSKNGIQYTRNVSDIKKAPEFGSGTDVTLEAFEKADGANENISEQDSTSGFDIRNADNFDRDDTNAASNTRKLRQRGNIKKPSRFDDKFVYMIFS